MKPTKLSILNFQFSISCALAVAVLLGGVYEPREILHVDG